jgi:hypothetical protein
LWCITPYIFCLTGLPCSPAPLLSAPSITSCKGGLEYCGGCLKGLHIL